MGVKISQLPAVSVPALSDIFPIVQSGVTYKETCTQLEALIDTTLQASGNYILTTSTTGQNINTTVDTATPSNVASLTNALLNNIPLITSGIIFAEIGEIVFNSASGGIAGGVCGALATDGTLSGTSITTAVYGSVNLTGATINGGLTAALYGAYIETAPTITSGTSMYGIAIVNGTGALLNSGLYLTGDATYLLKATGATTYFTAAGTGSGSWGNGTPPTPTKVLAVNIDAVTYYLPLVAQNSN